MKCLLFITLLLLSSCTTFTWNERGLGRACNNGIAQYDDGSMSFKCQVKNDNTQSR